MEVLTIRMKVPMNSLKNSRTICRSRNLAIAPEDRSSSLAARAAVMDDREEATDDVDAVGCHVSLCLSPLIHVSVWICSSSLCTFRVRSPPFERAHRICLFCVWG